MLTPLEISKKAFKGSVAGGYSKKDVDDFIEIVKEDYETLYRNVIDYKEDISRLKSELDRYSGTSEQLQKALTLAQKTADEIKLSAERQADLSIMQANVKSQQIMNSAESKLRNLNQMYRQFSSEFGSYLDTFRKLVNKLDEEEEKVSKLLYPMGEPESDRNSSSSED
jgi:cell division initiation protein